MWNRKAKEIERLSGELQDAQAALEQLESRFQDEHELRVVIEAEQDKLSSDYAVLFDRVQKQRARFAEFKESARVYTNEIAIAALDLIKFGPNGAVTDVSAPRYSVEIVLAEERRLRAALEAEVPASHG
jgi:chromosome segregation ATPase